MSEAASRPFAPPRGWRPEIDLADAASLVTATDVALHFSAPAAADLGPSLPGRIRGLLGTVLAEDARSDPNLGGPEIRRQRLFDLPDAFSCLFQGQGAPDLDLTNGVPVPSPYAIHADCRCGVVVVRIRLFGRAARHGPAVSRALRRGLASRGVSVAAGARSRFRVREEEIHCETEAAMVAPPPPPTQALRLVTQSPLFLGRGRAVAFDASALIGSILGRARGALAWSGYRLRLSTCQEREAQARSSLHDSTLRLAPGWHRRSVRQDRTLELFGMVGGATLRGLPPNLLSLIPIAELVGIGQKTTVGLGRVLFFFER